jgi:hypothetical protein
MLLGAAGGRIGRTILHRSSLPAGEQAVPAEDDAVLPEGSVLPAEDNIAS